MKEKFANWFFKNIGCRVKISSGDQEKIITRFIPARTFKRLRAEVMTRADDSIFGYSTALYKVLEDHGYILRR